MNSLLVELLTEELPPKALKKLGEAFASGVAQGLAARKLTGADAVVTSYATPRRLAVHINNVAAQSPDEARRDKVLPVAVAFTAEGKPQPPLLKKLASMGLDESVLPKLERAVDGKAEALFYSYTAKGQPLAAVLQDVLAETISKLPIPKVMFYERDDGTAVNFVRPAHGLVALHGSTVLPINALGVKAGNTTQGHRFHSNGAVTIANADSYVEALKQAHVVASYAERRASIEKQLNSLAKGDEIIAPEALLDEVTSLVEWPVVYECHFEKEFLEVPQECLILTMQTNQKYFATQKDGKLTHRFLIVSNIETKDPSLIIRGNERVVRPRLADAKFFFTQDKKRHLGDRFLDLQKVVYHRQLGSQYDRVQRIKRTADSIWRVWKGNDDKALWTLGRAAEWCKCDLLTDMVGEFPELQGTMGRYYMLAAKDWDRETIAQAIEEHYLPRFAGDRLPESDMGIALALADKLETLAGMFAIGQLPTGDKDPFALRRHALGIVRMLIENKLPLNLRTLAQDAYANFNGTPEHFEALMTFMFDRVAGYLRELGYSAQEAEAVLEARPAWSEIRKHLEAVRAFLELPEAQALAAANKRIGNILKKSDAAVGNVDETKLVEEAEKHLYVAIKNAGAIAEKLFENSEYTASLRELASLRGPVDAFFDKVMVNAEDPALKANRLALLQSLHTAMNRVADLSKLAS